MFVDERGHHFRRQSSTTCAKYADVFGRITFARLSALSDFTRIGPSLFHLGHGLENGTRLEEFIVSASSDDAPAFHDEDRVAGADRAESMGDHGSLGACSDGRPRRLRGGKLDRAGVNAPLAGLTFRGVVTTAVYAATLLVLRFFRADELRKLRNIAGRAR